MKGKLESKNAALENDFPRVSAQNYEREENNKIINDFIEIL